MMKKPDQKIPMVTAVPFTAVPVGAHDGAHSPVTTLSVVELPVGCSDLGFQAQGIPLVVTDVAQNSPIQDTLFVGHYIHGLIMPDIEIVNLSDPTHLTNMLRANVANPRQLLISSTPYYVDASIGTSTIGALYKHKLPAKYLGVTMRGFPPVIENVEPTSMMTGRLHPGQTVEALLVPGQPVMNLAAGAFTSAKLQDQLLRTAHMEGRQLVVKDGGAHQHQREKGSNDPFAMDDCCVIL
jgi:hypothetical protein